MRFGGTGATEVVTAFDTDETLAALCGTAAVGGPGGLRSRRLFGVVLMEIGDSAMMRRMLLGIRERAESTYGLRSG